MSFATEFGRGLGAGVAELGGRAIGPFLDLISGHTKRSAQRQGLPYHWSDVFFGAPQLREQYMTESAKQYNDLLQSMGPFAQQLMSGSPDAFSPLYQQAMQRFQTETAPQIAGMFGGRGGTRYSGAMDAALAQAGRMMGTDLAAQQMGAQMGLLQTLLGGMPGMRQVGELQKARPGLFELLGAPSQSGGRSPLETIVASGINALFPSGPTAQQRAATPLGVDTSGFGKFSLGPTMTTQRGGYGF